MRLTLYTDYAFRVLIYLETQKDRLVSIGEIARVYGVSENHLVKVVHRLGQHGFIKTLRGRKGGLRLGRDAAEIYLGDVVRCTEDDLALVSCMRKDEAAAGCILVGGCRLKQTLLKARFAFMDVLDSVTLADVTAPHERTILMDAVQEVIATPHEGPKG
ncbi:MULTISPECIES: Rrf2 family transcriptional regulator [Bombella]|uniref:Rrf2 family transcriptional regulator n=1 Tax=Bombella pollinis TaxID=2967337 RepID=A0ABT3WLD4_9PROT|nr:MULTISPECIES: Rrf2 family transcriptional regulator [Bombella]MCT6856326.1 Rrf2 family transcriptional regulator [Bombella apis]MCX5619851.1 Rrf2 family transcriptional regulator [Bombella pollinis]MUG04561.1 Rrf2 family transcriptional regulator [Bombella sp. ESL0378]MUG90055.1 Rrf2 family transcriptional regulator [Bombella sp. ESL0385]